MWNGVVCVGKGRGRCYYIEVIMQFRWDFFGRSTSTTSFGKFSRLMQHPVVNVFFVIHSATTIGPRSIASGMRSILAGVPSVQSPTSVAMTLDI